MNEFSLIEHYFKPLSHARQDVLLGIGDDAACLAVPEEMHLVVSTDTLVSNVHFLPHWAPEDIAFRALMVSVSDLAAMGAKPAYATLAITLPEAMPQWLQCFARGLSIALDSMGMSLVGGDTTKGPLSINFTVFGYTPKGKAVTRSGAKVGDAIFVSGPLGAAAYAVARLDDPTCSSTLLETLKKPKARVDFCLLLQEYASAAIDLSDGLSSDLNHILKASQVGACLEEKNIPKHPLLENLSPQKALDLALHGGDDYELCFSVPRKKIDDFLNALKKNRLSCYAIGVIEEKPGLRLKRVNQAVEVLQPQGYSHF